MTNHPGNAHQSTQQTVQQSAQRPAQQLSQENPQLPAVESLSYEEARNQLQELVAGLERGDVPLQRTLEMWQRGQELLTHCRSILDTATAKIDSANQESTDTPE